MSRKSIVTSLFVVFAAGTSLRAVPVAISNPSFELVVVADGASSADIVDWDQSTATGVFNPPAALYTTSIPDGDQVAALNNGGNISQSPTTIAAGTYTLSVDVGYRLDAPSTGFSYAVELRADDGVGGLGTLLDSSTMPTPTQGTFAPTTAVAIIGGGDATIGEPLLVRIVNTATGANVQTHFDAVSLDYAVPEPATGSLCLLGLAFGALAVRRRKS